jgi:hypothetical protein
MSKGRRIQIAMTSEVEKRQYSALPSVIFRHWIHSREEDDAGVEVFRPEGFDFPPAFARDGFEMYEDGRFVQEDIGPADGIVRVPGRWTHVGDRRVSVSFDQGCTARDGYTFEIVNVDESILQIRRVESDEQSDLVAVEDTDLQAFQALPPASAARRIDFDHARVVTLRASPPQYIVQVSGTKPYANMEVELLPLVYVRQPEHWEIEVVGTLRGFALPAQAPYFVSLPVTATLGSAGVEIVGASRRERIDVPTRPAAQGSCRDWAAWVDRQPPGPAKLHVTGRCQFPTGGFMVELRPRSPQGINPRDLLLDKIVQPPSGPATTAITVVEVSYAEQTDTGYDTVTILPDGVTIPVEEVH